MNYSAGRRLLSDGRAKAAQYMKFMASLRHLNLFGMVALAGVVIPFLMLLTEAVLIYFNPGYNPIVESISALGLKPLGWVQSISFLMVGLLTEIFAFGLYFSIKRRVGFRTAIALLVFFGFGLLLIGAFRTHPSGGSYTVENIIHYLTAHTIFALFPIACFLMAISLRADPGWKVLFGYTVVTGVIAAVLVILWISFQFQINWFGLYERILVANAVIWLEVMAINLLRLSIREVSGGGAI
jgi:hypothetical protein